MKKALKLLFIIIILVVGFFGVKYILKKVKLNQIKKGWYVEVVYNEPINIREEANRKSNALGKVQPGEIYKVLDINLENENYYWYKIDYNGKEVWIASKRDELWLKDVNNPQDIATPIIKFKDNIYKTSSIKDIDYKHLQIIDDRNDYKITHKVYYEYDYIHEKDQYWIAYTVTDASGKSSTKLQKIEFEENPDKEEVLDFSEYRK